MTHVVLASDTCKYFQGFFLTRQKWAKLTLNPCYTQIVSPIGNVHIGLARQTNISKPHIANDRFDDSSTFADEYSEQQPQNRTEPMVASLYKYLSSTLPGSQTQTWLMRKSHIMIKEYIVLQFSED